MKKNAVFVVLGIILLVIFIALSVTAKHNPTKKTLIGKQFSIDYPAELIASQTNISCPDGGNASTVCDPMRVIYSFINRDHEGDTYKYNGTNGNSVVAQIDILANRTIMSVTETELPNSHLETIGRHSFLVGENHIIWPYDGTIYLTQGNGYLVRIMLRSPKENLSYYRFPDLQSLVLR